jgi:hypothetical protein
MQCELDIIGNSNACRCCGSQGPRFPIMSINVAEIELVTPNGAAQEPVNRSVLQHTPELKRL